ncbi:MAG: hypothetical protein KF726_21870 [Anaerolineae bacterium]|nr:hypothetical protein [Anaerolineae bacterium]
MNKQFVVFVILLIIMMAIPISPAFAAIPFDSKAIPRQHSELLIRAFDVNASGEIVIAYTSGLVEIVDNMGISIYSKDFSLRGSASIRGIAWAPAPRDYLVAVNVNGDFPDRYVAIWDLSTDQVTIVDQAGVSLAFDWNADGTLLAIIYATGISEFFDTDFVAIWDVDNASVLMRFDEQAERFTAIAWRADYNEVAVGTASGDVIFWNIGNKVQYGSFAAHTDRVLDLSWSPTGDKLATVGGDFVVKAWDQISNDMLSSLPLERTPTQVLWRPNSTAVAVVETPYIVVFDALSNTIITTIDATSSRAAHIWAVWQVDGNALLYSAYNTPNQEVTINIAIIPTTASR